MFIPAANLFHPHSQKKKKQIEKDTPTTPHHKKAHLQVPVNYVVLVDVTDALQDLIDAVAERDRLICKSSRLLTSLTGKVRLGRLPGIRLAVVLSSNNVLKQLSSSNTADTKKTLQFLLRLIFNVENAASVKMNAGTRSISSLTPQIIYLGCG